MKRRTTREKVKSAALATIVVFAIGFVFAACKITVEFSQPVSGTVVDARNSALGISGAQVTVTCTSDSSVSPVTATTDSSGNWSTSSSVPAGIYQITVSDPGYFFPPTTAALAKNVGSVPAIPGFQLSTADANAEALSFILMWDASSTSPTDLDLDITYPNLDMASPSTDTTASGIFTSPYAEISQYWSNGFGPATVEGSPWNRAITTATTNPNFSLDQYDYVTHVTSSTNGGPETITFAGLPFAVTSAATYPINETASNGLTVFGNDSNGSPYTFKWMGVAQLYIDAPNTTTPISSSTTTTNAVVYAIQTTSVGGSPQATLLGVYRVPTNTNILATSIIRVNLLVGNGAGGAFYAWQLVPNLQVVPEGGGANGINFRSEVPVNGIVGVRGRALGSPQM